MVEFDIDNDLVRKLSALLDETGLTEIEFADSWSVLDVDSGDVSLITTYFAFDQFLFAQDFFSISKSNRTISGHQIVQRL